MNRHDWCDMAVATESLVTDNVHSVTQRDRNDEHFCKIKSISDSLEFGRISTKELEGLSQSLGMAQTQMKNEQTLIQWVGKLDLGYDRYRNKIQCWENECLKHDCAKVSVDSQTHVLQLNWPHSAVGPTQQSTSKGFFTDMVAHMLWANI